MKKGIVVGIIVLFVAGNAWASPVGWGNKLYEKGDYEKALEYYEKALKKNPESEAVNYNIGTAHYKTGDYEKAISFLQKSLLSDDQALRKKAHYNLGNAFYQYGVGKEPQDLNSAINSMEKSLGQYERAAQIDSEDTDVSDNYEFVKEELERLKKMLQEQQQQQQNQKNDQQQQPQKDQQQQGQNNQQQEQQNEQQKQDPSENEDSSDQQSDQEDEKKDDRQNNLGQNNENEQQQSSSSEDNSKQENKELSEQEVDMMLNDYKQNEEPQGLLNFMKRKGQDRPVEKDW